MNLGEDQKMPVNISEVKGFIGQNLVKIKTIKDVARGIGLSPDSLRKDFFRTTHQNLSEYILAVRIDKMKKRLLNSKDPCKIICIEVGCREDVGSRLFKRIVGISMNEFRHRYYHENYWNK